MVSIKVVRDSNSAISNTSPTALFVGATSGIGLSTIRQLLKHSSSPVIYIVGRSQTKFQSQLAELKALNPKAKLTFVEAQISLLKDVEEVCKFVSARESKLDLLWLSSGYLSIDAREDTLEGLTKHMAVTYYARMLFANLMLPLLRSTPSSRVVTVLAAGKEGFVNTSDLGLTQSENYSLVKCGNQQATMTSLAFEELSKENPSVSFIHMYPGFVKTKVTTNLFDGMSGWWTPVKWIVGRGIFPIVQYFAAMDLDEAGERGLFVATTDTFAVENKGFWRLDGFSEECGENKLWEQYRADGWTQKLAEHNNALFSKVLGSQ